MYKVLSPKRVCKKNNVVRMDNRILYDGSTRLTNNRAGRDKDTMSDTAEQKNRDLSHSYKDKSTRSTNIHQERQIRGKTTNSVLHLCQRAPLQECDTNTPLRRAAT